MLQEEIDELVRSVKIASCNFAARAISLDRLIKGFAFAGPVSGWRSWFRRMQLRYDRWWNQRYAMNGFRLVRPYDRRWADRSRVRLERILRDPLAEGISVFPDRVVIEDPQFRITITMEE